MAGRGAGGGPGKSDVHLGAVRGGGPRRSKHPPLRAAGGVSFRPEAGSQHLAFHSRERVLRCIDQYTARQYRHQSGQKEALAFARTSSCTSKTVSRVLYQTVIYLDVPSPVRSSHPGSGRASLGGRTPCSHTGVAPDRVYSIGHSRADGCALTAPFHPYLRYLHTSGGLFLLHFSSDRSGRALPVILALWSPDFPHSGPFGLAARLSVILAQLF